MNISNHTNEVKRKIQILHDNIIAMKYSAENNNAPDYFIRAVTEPIYKLLEQLYQRELPLATLMDNSEMVFHAEGDNIEMQNTGISEFTGFINNIRQQIFNIASKINNSKPNKNICDPLISFAPGSWFVGLSIPEPQINKSMLEKEDPTYKNFSSAMDYLERGIKHIESENMEKDIIEDIPEENIRLSVLTAIKSFSPSKNKGIKSLSISARNIPKTVVFQPEMKKIFSMLVKNRVPSKNASFTGIVREIDLDKRRFALRFLEISILSDIKCHYEDKFDILAKDCLLDHKIAVSGITNYNSKNTPISMNVDNINILDIKDLTENLPSL